MFRRTTLALALGLGLSALAPRPSLVAQLQTRPYSAAELDAPVAFDPLVRTDTLANGLVYFIRANKLPEHRAELRLAVRAGSVREDDDQRGLAHVLEHMAFNGTTSFPKNDLVHYLQSIGSRFGADVNASTGFDQTVYQLEVPTDTGKFLSTGIRILSEWAHGVTLADDDIDAERGVVTEEWRLGRGAAARMRDQQLPVLLKGSRYADRMVIGTLESLQEFSPEALRRFYHTWYRPDLMAVIAVGDFDVDSVEALIRSEFGAIPAPPPLDRPAYPVPPHDSVYVTIATDPEASNASVQLYDLVPPAPHATLRDFRQRYVEQLGLAMLNQRFAELTQRPDPPFAVASAGYQTFLETTDAVTLFAGVEPDSILRGFRAMLTEAERVRRFGFTDTELKRAIADAATAQESSFRESDKHPSSALASELLRHYLSGEEVLGIAAEHEAYQRINPYLTVAEVNKAARDLLAPHNPVILVNAPATPGLTVPTADQMLAAYRSARSQALEPYRDSVVSSTLVATPPPPAAITQARVLPAMGLTEWTLANGARVVLKPTIFKNDEVILSAISPGGTSLYPDSLAQDANFADTITQLGGVGDLSAVDLRKALSGKAVSVSTTIGNRSEGLSGRSTTADVATLLQLVYLRFTAPREDSSAFLAFRQTMKAAMANAAASPQKAFVDSVAAIITGHSPRAPIVTASTFDSLDLDAAVAIYKDRFADASDFTFVLVGAFDIDSVRPLVQRYLGGLPATHRGETARDVGPVPPEGRLEQVVRAGSEPQSQTVMVFSGPFTYDPEQAYLLSSLGEVLSNRLIDNLREKLGGTYSVTAQLQGLRDWPHKFLGFVQFGSAPDRADELAEAVLTQIRALADSGPSAAEIEKVREGQLRARETALTTNAFWAQQLAEAYQHGDDPRVIQGYRALVDGLTADKIRDAARQYLTGDNYIRVVLKPAEVGS